MTDIAVRLEDLIPEKASFTLKATGGIEHTLRIPNIQDHAWMKQTFGGEITKVLESSDKMGMARVVYRLLENRSPFMATENEEIDDDGVYVKVRRTGWENFARAVVGHAEQIEVYKALMSTVGLSKPVIENLKKKVEEAQAAEEAAKASLESDAPAGPTSST